MHWAIESFRSKFPEKTPHIVTTNIEHCATELPLKAWQKEGRIKVTFVPVENGIVEKDQIRNAVQDSTCLVTVMMANNETGVIQPIKEVVQMIKAINTTFCFINTPIAALGPPAGTGTRLVSPFLFSC